VQRDDELRQRAVEGKRKGREKRERSARSDANAKISSTNGSRVHSRGGMKRLHTVSASSQESSRRDRRKEGARAKGKGESYFWLLSRKSNLRSLTPKELQMHGRQHTGVSIYKARTETGEKDDGPTTTQTAGREREEIEEEEIELE